MKNLLVASFILLFFINAITHIPVTAKTGYATGTLLLPPKQDKGLDKAVLAQRCDSLILENNYKAVIDICTPYFSDRGYREIVAPYLIAARYFTGDSNQSRHMLLEEMKGKSYVEIIDQLIGDNVALIKYFDIDKNREPVIALALEQYRKTVDVARKQEGEQVIRFLINDQRIRKLKYAYKKESPAFLENLNRRRTIADSIQNDNIYHFYKKHGRYFGEAEIGKEASYWQAIFFSHINNIALRQNFFKSILEKAVKESIIDKETLVNFILRTESFTDPEFWNTINDRLPEIRKQYKLPDNYFFNPF